MAKGSIPTVLYIQIFIYLGNFDKISSFAVPYKIQCYVAYLFQAMERKIDVLRLC